MTIHESSASPSGATPATEQTPRDSLEVAAMRATAILRVVSPGTVAYAHDVLGEALGRSAPEATPPEPRRMTGWPDLWCETCRDYRPVTDDATTNASDAAEAPRDLCCSHCGLVLATYLPARAASPASETAQQRRCHCQNPSHAAPMQTGVCDDCGGEIEHAVDRFLAAKFLAAASETPAPEPSEIEALRTQADEMRRLAVIPGSWRCDQCSFALATVALNPHTGATGAQRVVDSNELRCPNDGTQLRSATWKERVADMAALIDRQDAELARLRGDDAGTPEAGPPLTPELREAMAKIEADVRRLQYRGDRARPFPTIEDILAGTPEEGTDLPRAITSAMFGNGYLLSEHRRLLAIALVSAIAALPSRSDRGNEHAGSERMEPRQ